MRTNQFVVRQPRPELNSVAWYLTTEHLLSSVDVQDAPVLLLQVIGVMGPKMREGQGREWSPLHLTKDLWRVASDLNTPFTGGSLFCTCFRAACRKASHLIVTS